MSREASGARRPEGLLLHALRAPRWVYRRDLGFLLGKRFLYLAHQGRLTGLRRETVLEVARLDHETGEVVVVAAWGNRADWVRNIRAGRALELRIGHLRFAEPEHRFLPAEECRSLLVSLSETHPLGWRLLTTVFPLPPDPKNDDLGPVRAVAFRPHVPAGTG
ncbi:nitroreductase/quinone reductase family protein [Actinoallomurus oryzae]|uniref:nitroreductase/quinone reductase family protein n=1 Tax=Actinoallomurus oryzae TaxID=502180 RepID=UPI0031EA30BC